MEDNNQVAVLLVLNDDQRQSKGFLWAFFHKIEKLKCSTAYYLKRQWVLLISNNEVSGRIDHDNFQEFLCI